MPPRDERTQNIPPSEALTRSLTPPDIRSSVPDTTIPVAAQETQGEIDFTVPGYKCLRQLGEGTYGEVWLYEAAQTGIQVAVKFFTRSSGSQWRRLRDEVQQLAKLHADPGIVQLHGVGDESRTPYFIMRYAEGGSLEQLLAQGRLPLDRALALFRQMSEALAYVHVKGIRHCDLKPANILLDARGKPLLGDFGQARLISDQSPVLGTWFYMAPDQADLRELVPDSRWDVFALGVILYRMLTGEVPRHDPVVVERLLQPGLNLTERLRIYREHVQYAPHPKGHRQVPGVDRWLVEIVDRSIDADPARRYRDAGDLLEALNERERQIKQQRVLFFGLLAPMLVLVAMAVAAFLFARGALGREQDALMMRVRESSQALSGLVASEVGEKLRERIERLKAYAGNEDLRKMLQENPEGRDKLNERLERFRRTAIAREMFFKLTLFNLQARIIGDDPPEPELYGINYSHRDYWNGKGQQPKDPDVVYPHVTKPHISQPYVGAGVGKSGTPDPLMLSITVPVYAPNGNKEIIGLLVGSLEVEDLHRWLDSVALDAGPTVVVLLNQRRHVLYRSHEKIAPPIDRNPEPLDSPLLQSVQEERQRTVCDDYQDPMDGKVYVAGYAPAKYGWSALVQYDRDAALQPVDAMRHWMVLFGLGTLGVAALLLTGLWQWLIHVLRRTPASA
jgi:hypothetical protein